MESQCRTSAWLMTGLKMSSEVADFEDSAFPI